MEKTAEWQSFYLLLPADRLNMFYGYDVGLYHVQPNAKRELCLSRSGRNKQLRKQAMLYGNVSSFHNIKFYELNNNKPFEYYKYQLKAALNDTQTLRDYGIMISDKELIKSIGIKYYLLFWKRKKLLFNEFLKKYEERVK